MNKYLNVFTTSPFGIRKNPTGTGDEFHRGNDKRPVNHDTYAGISGIVTKSTFGTREGNFIQIKGNIEGAVFYENLFHNEIRYVKSGATVSQGEIVAKSGSTGNSTGEHIHDEIFTYEQNNPFVIELKKEISNYLEKDNRLFFDPEAFYKYMDSINIKY